MYKSKFVLLYNVKNDGGKFTFNESRNEQNIINNNSKAFILLLLIVNFIIIKEYISSINKDEMNFQINLNDDSIMGTQSLYKIDKYEQITLLIYGINEWEVNKTSLLNFIDCLEHQTLKDIQIVFILTTNLCESKQYHETEKIIKNKKMEIYISSENMESNTNYLMNLIKGKFTLILDKFVLFSNNELEKLFIMSNGKIDNNFEIQIQNKSFHLIRTKVLRNLVEDGQLFNNYNDLINNITNLPNPKLNYISIAICPNDYYVPFTYVSMLSILSSKGEFTFISFYLVISEEFQNKNVDFLLSLYEQFDFFNITFVKMDNRYKNAYISKRMTIQTYFRFSLGELFPFLNRMLYLDSDIIVYKDLSKLFNLNFNGKMVLGQVTGYNRNKRTGFYKINNGILLFNLNLMRKMEIENQVLQIIKKRQRLRYHDQTLMNFYFKKHIGIFPIEYHIRNWGNFKEMEKWNKIAGSVYDKDYLYFAQKYPSIRHFLGPKNFLLFR